MVYISGIDWESVTDGEGVRVTLFISGCMWNCKGCHNPDTHSFTNGEPFTEEILNDIINYIKSTSYIKGVTLSGGDPMFSADELIPYVKKIKEELPHINIWCYTGFKFSDLLIDQDKVSLLEMIDILVDGTFDLSQRDITLKWRGSPNQRIIDVQRSLKEEKIFIYMK